MLDRYKITAVLSVLASVSGILISIFLTHNKDDGGRGGAVGTCIALVFMFLNHGYGGDLYKVLTETIPELEQWLAKARDRTKGTAIKRKEDISLAELEVRVNAIAAAVVIDGAEQQWQNRYLAGATTVGTLIWGFGDLIAKYFLKPQ